MVPLIFGGKIYNTLKAGDVVQDRHRAGLLAVCGDLLFQRLDLARNLHRLCSSSARCRCSAAKTPTATACSIRARIGTATDIWTSSSAALPPTIDTDGDGKPDAWADINGDGKPDKFDDIDKRRRSRRRQHRKRVRRAGRRAGRFPTIDFSTIALLAAFAAIAGCGGLVERADQQLHARPGLGHGTPRRRHSQRRSADTTSSCRTSAWCFKSRRDSLPRWRRWYRHVLRDQLVVWMPACFLGMALPSMLSVQFLRRGTEVSDWYAAGMTADGVSGAVGDSLGLAGRLDDLVHDAVVRISGAGAGHGHHADGVVRRWVDVVWTSSRRLARSGIPSTFATLYFGVLVGFMAIGLFLLSIGKPLGLLKIGTNIMNFALGFSCFHTLVINLTLLPKELRPGWFVRLGLAGGRRVLFLAGRDHRRSRRPAPYF